MKKITLKIQSKEKYYMPIAYDYVYQIINEDDVPIGIIYLSDMMDNNVYIEWIEILTPFRGLGYLRLIFKNLCSLFKCDIHLQCGEEILRKYTGIGCEEQGVDECTENYRLVYNQKNLLNVGDAATSRRITTLQG